MSKRIAVVNRTNLKNYGSVLQVYALCEAIKKLGYDSEVVWQTGNLSKNYDIRPKKIMKFLLRLIAHPSLIISTWKLLSEVKNKKIDEQKVKLFDEFVIRFFNQSFYSEKEIKAVAESDKYYKFICGSDQVWVTTTLNPEPMMYLRFAPKEKRLAYAPSLGRDYLPKYNEKILRRYISDIPHVSVREETGAQIIKNLTNRDVPVVADPTLLLKREEWSKLECCIPVPEDYILCYFLDAPSMEVSKAIHNYSDRVGKRVVMLGTVFDIHISQEEVITPHAGPGEFLYLISKASVVITDSYHGVLFAINYQKDFWSVERAYSHFNQSSRQKSILSRFGLEDRYLKDEMDIEETHVDYMEVNKKKDAFVVSSMQYLRNAIAN